MKKLSLTFIATLFVLSLTAQTTYLTTGDGTGIWSDPNSWKVASEESGPAGPPTANDHVIISHSLTHFAKDGYTHAGNVAIMKGASYEIISGFDSEAKYVFAGETFEVEGSLLTTADFQHQLADGNGNLVLHPTSMAYFGDDVILEGNGGVILNNSNCGSAKALNDVCYKGVGTFVCGTGNFVVGNELRAWNTEGKELTSAGQAQQHIAARTCANFSFFSNAQSCTTDESLLSGQLQFRLLSFEARQVRSQIELRWNTENEVINETYIVERSLDGTLFEPVGEANAKGTLGTVAEYQLKDMTPANGTIFYRLKQTLADGSFQYSSTVKVEQQILGQSLNVFPNPTTGPQVMLQSQGFAAGETVQVEIRSLLGQSVVDRSIPTDRTGVLQHDLQHNLQPGTYILTVKGKTQQVSSLLEVR
ncbi:MAG: T9SS type A sorting domain-containing protein [Bacteroidota bacterium]